MTSSVLMKLYMRIFLTICPKAANKPKMCDSHFAVEWHKGLTVLSLMNVLQRFLWCETYANLCLE